MPDHKRQNCSLESNLRTSEMQEEYDKAKRNGEIENCIFCHIQPIKEYKYWKIAKSKFPYDKIACVHDMIYPIRHTDGSDLTEAENQELTELKNGYLNDNYQMIMEPLPARKSIPGHFHLHVVVTYL